MLTNFARAEIMRIFKKETGIDIPYHPALGIDIVELDKKIGTPEGKSMKQHLKDKYGELAMRAVRELISH